MNQTAIRFYPRAAEIGEEWDAGHAGWPCHGCKTADCCYYGVVPTAPDEVGPIYRAYTQLTDAERKGVDRRLKVRRSRHPDSRGGYPCPFLEKNRCLIYGVRPLVCRTYGHTVIMFPEKLREALGKMGDIQGCPKVLEYMSKSRLSGHDLPDVTDMIRESQEPALYCLDDTLWGEIHDHARNAPILDREFDQKP